MSRQALSAMLFFLIAGSMLAVPVAASAETNAASIIHRINSSNEQQEMMVNSSRILTLERKIPQAQVNNPEILTLTPLSPTEIQLAARKAGVTQVNLWDENNQIFTVDVVVYGDTRELQMILDEQFPNASLKVRGISSGVLISGFVDQPYDVQAIVQIAEQFYPQKVSTRLQVGGVQQVLLHVKVMEVSTGPTCPDRRRSSRRPRGSSAPRPPTGAEQRSTVAAISASTWSVDRARSGDSSTRCGKTTWPSCSPNRRS